MRYYLQKAFDMIEAYATMLEANPKNSVFLPVFMRHFILSFFRFKKYC